MANGEYEIPLFATHYHLSTTHLPPSLSVASLPQAPVTALDLEHAEGGQIEPQMVGWRHVDDAAGADEIFRLLDLVAHLGLVEAAGAFCGLHEDHQAVISVAPEGRDRLAGLLLVSPGICNDNRFLRVAVRELLGHQQRRGRQPHAVGGGAGKVDELLRGDAVALIERQRDAELPVIAGHNRRPLAEARIYHGLHASPAPDVCELPGHVALAPSVC